MVLIGRWSGSNHWIDWVEPKSDTELWKWVNFVNQMSVHRWSTWWRWTGGSGSKPDCNCLAQMTSKIQDFVSKISFGFSAPETFFGKYVQHRMMWFEKHSQKYFLSQISLINVVNFPPGRQIMNSKEKCYAIFSSAETRASKPTNFLRMFLSYRALMVNFNSLEIFSVLCFGFLVIEN